MIACLHKKYSPSLNDHSFDVLRTHLHRLQFVSAACVDDLVDSLSAGIYKMVERASQLELDSRVAALVKTCPELRTTPILSRLAGEVGVEKTAIKNAAGETRKGWFLRTCFVGSSTSRSEY